MDEFHSIIQSTQINRGNHSSKLVADEKKHDILPPEQLLTKRLVIISLLSF